MSERIIIETAEVGPFFANCYIIGEPDSTAFIIDPGDERSELESIIKKHKFKPLFIINTHGHIDHIKEDASFNLPVFIHNKDIPLLKSPDLNLSSFLGNPFKLNDDIPVKALEDGDSLELQDKKIEIIHTPGHTQGGICIKFDEYLFSGDTLFCNSIGRTDFKGGDYETLIESIKNKLFCLNEDLIVLPGHGPRTTLSKEKRNNPFLQ